MSYTPPNVTTQALGSGVHPVWMTNIKEIADPGKLAKFQAQALFIATFKSVETAQEIDLIIKFNGSKADYYAGLNIDRLHLAAGLPEPAAGEVLDLVALGNALDGVELQLEVNDKGYANAVFAPQVQGEDVI